MAEKKKSTAFNFGDVFFTYNRNVLIIGSCLLVLGAYLNGIAAIYQALTCISTCIVSEYISFKLVLKKNTLADLSAVSTGLLITLLLPACAPLWVGAMASVFAIVVAKLPFGSANSAPFVPACAGICFVSICFPQLVFTYCDTSSTCTLFSTDEGFVSGASLLSLISGGKSPTLNIFSVTSILSGSYPGAIGATSMLAMGGVIIYLLFQKNQRLSAALGYILTCAAFSFAFPRVNSGRLSSVIFELSAGTLVFTALLLITDPSVCPSKFSYGLVYGSIAAVICMLLRRYAKIEDPSCFSVLLINALWPAIANNTMFKKVKKNSGGKSEKKTAQAAEEKVPTSEVTAVE